MHVPLATPPPPPPLSSSYLRRPYLSLPPSKVRQQSASQLACICSSLNTAPFGALDMTREPPPRRVPAAPPPLTGEREGEDRAAGESVPPRE
jgi:hypothetical protein